MEILFFFFLSEYNSCEEVVLVFGEGNFVKNNNSFFLEFGGLVGVFFEIQNIDGKISNLIEVDVLSIVFFKIIISDDLFVFLDVEFNSVVFSISGENLLMIILFFKFFVKNVEFVICLFLEEIVSVVVFVEVGDFGFME